MRTLAARIGVRASSLYRHFPDRSAIEKALALKALDQLLEAMKQSVAGLTGERALFAAARAYLDFAIAEGPFYDMIMSSIVVAAPADSSNPQPTKLLWDFFVQLVSDTTHISDDAPGAAALWSYIHGFTVLLRSGQLGDASTKLTFARGTQALVRGLAVPEAEAMRSGA